jgi:AraC-like DNA-binding protein
VAARLGFTDPANFGRFFPDRTGLIPAAFAARDATRGQPCRVSA